MNKGSEKGFLPSQLGIANARDLHKVKYVLILSIWYVSLGKRKRSVDHRLTGVDWYMSLRTPGQKGWCVDFFPISSYMVPL